MKPILVLFMFLVASPVWAACGSFEDCMQDSERVRHNGSSDPGHIKTYPEAQQRDVLKAIAFKLDEISQKLDKKEKQIRYSESRDTYYDPHLKGLSKKKRLRNKENDKRT